MGARSRVMGYILLILILCFSCKNGLSPDDDSKLKMVAKNKKKEVFIALDNNLSIYFLRKKMVEIVKKIKLKNPKVIHFHFYFTRNSLNIDNFAKKLNNDFPVISLFHLSSKPKEVGFIPMVENSIGIKIKGKIEKFDNQFYKFQGVEFPQFEIIRENKALCTHILYPNEQNEFENIYTHHGYKNYLFEDCSVTIANEFLNSYDLRLLLDDDSGKLVLYSLQNNRRRFIKYLEYSEKSNDLAIPIDYQKIRSINANEFLKKDFLIDPGTIFFVGVMEKKFNTPVGMLSSPEILASEVYTLLDLVSRP